MDSSGATSPLIDVPPQTSKVMPCGERALSPNGRFFTLYLGLVGDQGLQSGSLYTMTDGAAPVLLHDAPLLTCLGNGTFQYSPDSARLAYVDYAPGAATDTFAHGFLHIVNTADMSEVTTFERATAFTMASDGIAFVSFFTNDQGNADEAAVTWWDGNIDREITTLTPTAENCFFTNATLAATPDGKLIAVLGHRCTRGDTSTNWQLYSIDRAARSATLISSSPQPGAFTSFTRTNNVYIAPGGSTAYFTIPDGVTANTVGVSAIDLSNATITPVIERQAVFPTFQGAANAFPRVSPDGKWLAMVVTTPNSDNTLTVIKLDDPTAAPISVSAGSRGDTISNMAFTPDSSHLVYVAGGDNNANNSLFSLDLASGSETRVRRGRFAQGFALSPAGTEVAIMDWQFLEDPQQPPYIKLEVINLESSEVATLFEGADIVDNKVQNQRFAWPMLWLRSGG
jgi:Tol biopolymer transport system component